MYARWRVIAPWICVVGVLGALWLAKLSPSYKQCDAHEKQYAATEKARNSQEERARRFVICEGAFVDANREAITAAATVAIAAFTLVLWLATSRQARLTAQTIALARDEFNATHRPRIRVRHVTLDRLYDKDSIPFEAGQPIYGRFDIVNVGAVEARVMGWRAFLLIGQEGNPPPWPTLVDPDPESDEFESLRPILSPGVYAELRVKSRHPSSATAASDLIHLSAGWRLFAIGRITYADRNEISRTTEFCRCWRMPEGTKVARFHRVDDPDYENED